MIQFNLLPDVKLEYIRTNRVKRLVITVALLVTGLALAVTGFLAFNVYGLQRGHIDNLTGDIQDSTESIKSIDQIDRMLTVQNQLNTITGLHDDKPVASRLFPFMSSITPTEVNISELEISFENETMIITGEADSLESVNVFVDTLKFIVYSQTDPDSDDDQDSGDIQEEQEAETEDLDRAFVGVELSDFDRTSEGASFIVTATYVPQIFSSEADVALIVRNTITTRSEQESPDALFVRPAEEENGESN